MSTALANRLFAAAAVSMTTVMTMMVLVGCASSPDDVRQVVAPPSTRARIAASVAVIGDSLTDQSRVDLDVALRGAGVATLVIDAEWGRALRAPGLGQATGLEAIARAANSGDPDVWVVALGTNDVLHGDEAQWATDIREALRVIEAGDGIVWVTPAISADGDEIMRGSIARFNATVVGIAAADPRVTVVDFQPVADTPGALKDDRVHLTGDGIVARTTLIVEGVIAAARVTG